MASPTTPEKPVVGRRRFLAYVIAAPTLTMGVRLVTDELGGLDDVRLEVLRPVLPMLAGSAETTRAIWSIVGSHSSIAKRVLAYLIPDDPVAWLTREPVVGLADRKPWMLRVVDAAAAISGRGFPAVAELAVTLRLDDEQLPANAGLWTLRLGGGEGSLRPAGTDSGAAIPPAGPVRLGARGFAALYAGVPMSTLRGAGLAAGGDAAADEALDSAFAGSAFMLDAF